MKRLEALLWRNGLRRGVFGGSQPWTAVAMLVGGFRFLRWLTRPGDGVVYREELQPGETLEISHLSD